MLVTTANPASDPDVATPPDPLAGLDPTPGSRPPSVVLSYGLGVDSTAILLRWLTDPTSRDFDLNDLVVVTAMTGDEWPQTGHDVEAHVLPLLRAHGVRYVQAARARRHVSVTGSGLVVLDDSAAPTRLHLAGAYKLSDEMREAGTIPQSGGMRACSVHSKGDCLDPVIARLTAGQSYRHVIGFEAGEPRRAIKDAGYNTATRTGEYPLIAWGWDRAACEDYITAQLDVAWSKSACGFCPFALGSKAGRTATIARYATHPTEAIAALAMEHTALALNPTQGLIAGKRLVDEIAAAGHTHLLDALDEHLNANTYALYEVRRILRPRADDPTRLANSSRSVRALARGTRDDVTRELLTRAATADVTTIVGPDGILRAQLRSRTTTLPGTEHFWVCAPDGVLDKQHDKFEQWWASCTDTHSDTDSPLVEAAAVPVAS